MEETVRAPEIRKEFKQGMAKARMREIAQGIYDNTPGIQEEIPKHSSKILQTLKNDKKGGKYGVGGEPIKYQKYEAWETMYKDALDEYKEAKERTKELKERLTNKQWRYIDREEEYKDVVDKLETKKKDNSTQPLVVMNEKMNDEDDLLLQGVDLHDQEQLAKIERQRELQRKSAMLFEGANNNQTVRKIKELNKHRDDFKGEIDNAHEKIS